MTIWKPSTTATTIVRGGMKQLTQFLRKEEVRFTSSPIVLIVSQPIDAVNNKGSGSINPDKYSITTTRQAKIHMNAIQQTQYMLQQQLGFQTIVAHCSPSAYPTRADIDNVTNVAHRIGAYTIAAVGTGNAIDLAKAVYTNNDLYDELLLIPTTYGGSIASMSSHSLFYDREEDTLIPQPQPPSSSSMSSSVSSSSDRPKIVFALSDEDHDVTKSMFDTATNRHCTLLALLTIILDCIYQNIPPTHRHDSTIPNECVRLVEQIFVCLDNNNTIMNDVPVTTTLELEQQLQQHETLLNMCHEVGTYISYGLQQQQIQYITDNIHENAEEDIIYPRSIPIAIAASLASSNVTFAQYTTTTIIASFVLAYCDLVIEKINNNNRYTTRTGNEKKIINYLEQLLNKNQNNNNNTTQYYNQMVPKIVTNESLSTIISSIRTNQIVWNCYDNHSMNTMDLYSKLFQHHLLI
jgi:hypothetical protein